MPIIAKNIIKKAEEGSKPPLQSKIKKEVVKKEEPKASSPQPKNIKEVIKKMQPEYRPPKEGTVLVVNGKERKIGKKSQYLLDMLTLED